MQKCFMRLAPGITKEVPCLVPPSAAISQPKKVSTGDDKRKKNGDLKIQEKRDFLSNLVTEILISF